MLCVTDARVNFISGTLPQLPPTLRFVSLHFNLIGGFFPRLSGLVDLRQLDMVHNRLSVRLC